MNLEIERKFLVANDLWKKEDFKSYKIKQGYLSRDKQTTVRVRIKDESAFLTVKGKSSSAISRLEFEYKIPKLEAMELLKLSTNSIIEKTRYEITYLEKLWELDVFEGDNEGLLVAEIELKSESEKFEKPDWLGKEVSTENKYYNVMLSENPFKNWKK